jgi:hypothetical protein
MSLLWARAAAAAGPDQCSSQLQSSGGRITRRCFEGLVPRCAFRYTEVEMTAPSSMPLSGYSPDGVDVTLIRWFLSLTPAQRLDFHERHMEDILAIRKLNARG